MAEPTNPSEGGATPAPQKPQQTPIQVDDSKVTTDYANFCFVAVTAEEVILNFAMNTEPVGRPNSKVRLNTRVVTNFYTAKRLLMALNVAVQKYEQAFGPLEMDVTKRLQKMGGGGTTNPPGT